MADFGRVEQWNVVENKKTKKAREEMAQIALFLNVNHLKIGFINLFHLLGFKIDLQKPLTNHICLIYHVLYTMYSFFTFELG